MQRLLKSVSSLNQVLKTASIKSISLRDGHCERLTPQLISSLKIHKPPTSTTRWYASLESKLASPTPAEVITSFSATGAFKANQPLKIKDARNGTWFR